MPECRNADGVEKNVFQHLSLDLICFLVTLDELSISSLLLFHLNFQFQDIRWSDDGNSRGDTSSLPWNEITKPNLTINNQVFYLFVKNVSWV